MIPQTKTPVVVAVMTVVMTVAVVVAATAVAVAATVVAAMTPTGTVATSVVTMTVAAVATTVATVMTAATTVVATTAVSVATTAAVSVASVTTAAAMTAVTVTTLTATVAAAAVTATAAAATTVTATVVLAMSAAVVATTVAVTAMAPVPATPVPAVLLATARVPPATATTASATRVLTREPERSFQRRFVVDYPNQPYDLALPSLSNHFKLFVLFIRTCTFFSSYFLQLDVRITLSLSPKKLKGGRGTRLGVFFSGTDFLETKRGIRDATTISHVPVLLTHTPFYPVSVIHVSWFSILFDGSSHCLFRCSIVLFVSLCFLVFVFDVLQSTVGKTWIRQFKKRGDIRHEGR